MTYTSPTKKAWIVLLRSEGVSEKEIAERYSVDRSTVNRIFKRYKESKNFYHTKEKSRRPRNFTTHDIRIVTRMLVSTKHMTLLISKDSISPICILIQSRKDSPNAD